MREEQKMRERNSHPAILAGLMGVAEWGVPTVAVATPLDDVVEAVSGSLLLQFVVGCAAGAVVAGIISLIADKIESRSEKAEEHDESEAADLELDDQRWASSSLSLIRAQAEEADDDPTGDLGRFRTGRISIGEAAVQEEAATPKAKARPRHGAHMAPARAAAPASRRSSGRHFAGAAPKPVPAARAAHFAQSQPKPAPAVQPMAIPVAQATVTPIKGRHFAAAVSARREDIERLQMAEEQRRSGQAAQAVAPKAVSVKPASHAQSAMTRRARLLDLPMVEPVAEASVAPVVPAPEVPAAVVEQPVAVEPAPASSVEEKSASSEVTHRLTLRERVAKRRQSVREVLADRLGADGMGGIPVITRADGSVGDVRTSWFDQTLVPVLASITGVTVKAGTTATRAMDETPAEMVAREQVATEAESRASYISQRVAEVNVGMFPERRSAEELEHEDVWEQALAAMGETIRQESPVFQDVVGGPSTIDDPDGLEGPTGFIPFRVPAGRPEVVDTETYIDYLLRDEFSQNESQVIRRSSRNYLRVIEGGTSPVRPRRRPSETGAVSTGRHFAPARYAAEA